MLKNNWISLFIAFLFLTACEEVVFDEYENSDPHAIFDEAWTFADHYYSYFDLKGVDWDSVYHVYKPQVRSDMDDVELFDLLSEMFYGLEDGHVNLRSPFDRSRYWEWYLNAPENFDYSVLEREYFTNEHRFIGPFETLILDSIAYTYLGSFSSEFSEEQLNLLIQSFEGTKGVIVDVRNNGGGSSNNAKRLASRFISESLLVGQRRHKNGPEKNAFSEWEDVTLKSAAEDDAPVYDKPVVVLANRKSYSATNFFVQYMSEMEGVTIIGNRTGGGAGTPKFTELANGWILRLSATQFRNTEGRDIESGVPVDIELNITEEDRNRRKDTFLEYALRFLQ